MIRLALFVFFLGGCAPALVCTPGFVADDDVCMFDEESVLELVTHFDDGALKLANAEPFDQTIGTFIRRNVWVSSLPVPELEDTDTLALYQSADPAASGDPLAAPFPVGTLFIHEAVDREEGHGVLVKRDDYSNAQGGPWWFGKVFDDGTYDTNVCNPCESCHIDPMHQSNDTVWGVPRDAL